MIRITLGLLLLSIIIIYGNTISGFGTTLKEKIWKTLLFPKYPITVLDRPWFCNLCLTWWIGLAVLIATHNCELLTVIILVFVSYFTDVTETVMRMIKDLVVNIVNQLYKLVDKLA